MHLLKEEIIEGYISGSKCVSNSYTVYEIIIVTNIPNMKNHQVIYKRYSEFRDLHEQVKKEIKELPTFPKKKFWKLKEEIIKERILRFNFYIKYLCMLITKKEINEECKERILKFIRK
ncbi:sorting nexin-3 (SNX24) [Vairimorpha necatrix]|uniref:Sorting nexin-3 (SNX24) n=1 Tax=Vairimorpha necatrix TaxID=6039 RepID=A0AAX4JC94_9MICR